MNLVNPVEKASRRSTSRTSGSPSLERSEITQLRKRAAALLDQQCWCWGRDVLRPEGNWLLASGFERLSPPSDCRDGTPSIYQQSFGGGRQVVLRGFGVFYGNPEFGGVFLSRDKQFSVRYSPQAQLDKAPWSDTDLPKLQKPNEANQRCCAALTLELVRWFGEYETTVIHRLGLSYRQAALAAWDNGKRACAPADEFAGGWITLAKRISDNLGDFLRLAT
ncbi:hypothetical protein [Blastopirellula marina]|uniref:hypothetical protein n=1 Tax=Blastopirellula marina TaxID=124 RepID=UPI0011AFE209|nr:hypothetical protein [Blastopirellula marina]